jgi:integrase
MIGCRPFSPRETREILDAFEGEFATRDRCLFALGCSTGFRISELLALRVKDLLNGPQLAEVVRVPRRAMKGKKNSRTARLAPFARPFVAAWLEELEALDLAEPDVPLFLSRKSLRPISRVQAWRILRQAFRAAEIYGPDYSLGTHTMRKTYADRMYAHYGDIFKVQKAMGHASPASTVNYLSFHDEEQAEAVELAFPELTEELANVERFPSAANDE